MASIYKVRLSVSGSEDKLYRMNHHIVVGGRDGEKESQREKENHNTAHIYGSINLNLILES